MIFFRYLLSLDPETHNRKQNNFKNYFWSELKYWPLKQKHSNQTQMVRIILNLFQMFISIFYIYKETLKKISLMLLCTLIIFGLFYLFLIVVCRYFNKKNLWFSCAGENFKTTTRLDWFRQILKCKCFAIGWCSCKKRYKYP